MTPDPVKILVVDDSISIVNSLCKMLELHGYEVDSAYNGSDALRKINHHDYDVVVCDIEMPGISGMNFLERVRKDFGRNLDVILMTGFVDHDYFIQAIRLGASDFIRKPIEANQIIRSIQSIMSRRIDSYDTSTYYQNLEYTQMGFEISPENFARVGISRVFGQILRNNFKLRQDLMNELLICIDEMVYNAFVHGTLRLSTAERVQEHDSLQELIAERLKDPAVQAKRIRFGMVLSMVQNKIIISVEDDGDGFDYESWLNHLKQGPDLHLDEHGRGLTMLYHLADELKFSNGGRKVEIIRSLPKDNPNTDEDIRPA
jgi:CheY-like chemotaxis protein/anti-sigma regulatory factor (Ser/Thr protein kinase)